MGKIVPKLDLNKTPQKVEDNSLIFAKNISLDNNQTIIPDNSIKCVLPFDKEISGNNKSLIIKGYIVGLDRKIYLFIRDVANNIYRILEYDEETKSTRIINCSWTYHGGIISGNVTTNNTNEYILNICESKATTDVPIKHINLSKCSFSDDESIYTQAPNIPFTNFSLNKTYVKNIPNGVYQFFVRYRIRDDFYTSWFPCSKECFAGNGETVKTIQGQIKYIFTNRDAAKSFIFTVRHLFNGENNTTDYTKIYKDFQVGFILSTNDSTVARSWKSFTFDVNEIYFDYDESAIKEINIDDILMNNYELFNVENITYFKDKQYIANYKETDFNPTNATVVIEDGFFRRPSFKLLSEIASDIKVDLYQKDMSSTQDTTYIDSIELSNQQTFGQYTVFTKWGDKDAKELISQTTLLDTTSNESDEGVDYKTKNDTSTYPNGAYTANLYCDYTHDPDLMFVNKGTTDIQSNVPGYIANFDLNHSYGNYLNLIRNYTVSSRTVHDVQDKFNHSWCHKVGLDGHWYFRSPNTPGAQLNNFGRNTFTIYDNGFNGCFSGTTGILNDIETSLTNYFKSACGEQRIIAAYIQDTNLNKYYIQGTIQDKDKPLNFIGSIVQDRTRASYNCIIASLKNNIVGIDSNGYFLAKFVNGGVTTYIPFSQVFIVFSTFKYDVEGDGSSESEEPYDANFRVDVTRRNYTLTCNCNVNNRYIKNSVQDLKEYTSLLPFTYYDFYIHFVKQNGIATNGYKINGGNSVCLVNHTPGHTYYNKPWFDNTKLNSIIYPEFKNIVIPNEYVAAFITIYKSNNDVCKLFNHELRTDGYHYADCLEADALLYNIKTKVLVINSNNQELTDGGNNPEKVDAEYYSSSDHEPIEMLGNSGCVRWARNVDTDLITFGLLDITYPITASGRGVLYYTLYLEHKGDKFIDIIVPADYSSTQAAHYLCTHLLDNELINQLVQYDEMLGMSDIESSLRIKTFYKSSDPSARSSYKNGENAISAISLACSAVSFEEAHRNALLNKTFATEPVVTDDLWLKINTKDSNNKDRQLIKITPYFMRSDLKTITLLTTTITGIYSNIVDYNLPGHHCKVIKPNRNYSNGIYVSGTDIYTKDIATDMLKLELVNDYVTLKTSNIKYILSNYNLNYVSLNDSLNAKIRSFKFDEDGKSFMQMIKALESLTASFMLTLVGMYKTYLRKYYYVVDENKKTRFDNTIRSSDINIDEVYRNIYRFHPEDYYNVPANRGEITNLYSIINEIYIHTKHSFYKFSGNNTLSTNEGEVNLKESNVFETGITEIFDSQHGYAGLANKKHSLVTFTNYVFYDELIRTIFAYDPHSGINAISAPIAKLIEYLKPIDVLFAEDPRHNRFFINFKNNVGNVCLSYNFDSKAFVSIHDFDFREAFASRTNTYFIQDYERTEIISGTNYSWYKDCLFAIDNDNYISDFIVNNNALTVNHSYDWMFKQSILSNSDVIYWERYEGSGTNLRVIVLPMSTIDVICNQQYEKIKAFNEVTWSCISIASYLSSGNVAEESNNQYGGSVFIIYSDRTMSSRKLGDNNISNNQSLDSNNYYEFIRYNEGLWTANFYRDNKNQDYADTDKSMIYGKYFVFRVYFNNKKFKIENVTFNYNNYEKA